MIALVSSTLAPSEQPSHDGARTTFSPAERLEQTRGTVASLLAAGIQEIIIADNSAGGWRGEWTPALAPARILHYSHPPFRNKGLGEMWLLIDALAHLPADVPMMKISGRYRVGPASPLLAAAGADVVARVYARGRRREISTRCYVVRSRDVAARLWPAMLDEMYAQAGRIVGPRSLLDFAGGLWRPGQGATGPADPPAAVELAAYDALRRLGLSLAEVDHLEVEGVLGSWINPAVKE